MTAVIIKFSLVSKPFGYVDGLLLENSPKMALQMNREENIRKILESLPDGILIVKQLVEENGGKVWVESTLGEESKFHFTIPKN